VQQHRVTALHRIHRFDEQVGGHTLEDGGRGDVKADTVRHPRYDIGWRDAVFRIGADRVGAGNPVTDSKRRNPVTHRSDGAGDLGAKDKR
jgi:hypothetical protein